MDRICRILYLIGEIIVAGIIVAVAGWFTMLAFGSDLDDYLKKEKIIIPERIQHRIETLNLVPMFGMTMPNPNCGESHFLIEYCHKDDIQSLLEPQQMDVLRDHTTMRLKYYAKQCKWTIEYCCYYRIWGSVPYEPVWVQIDFSFL